MEVCFGRSGQTVSKSVQVTVSTPSSGAVIAFNPTTVAMTYVPGTQFPIASVAVTNSGTSTLPALNATASVDWLALSFTGSGNNQTLKITLAEKARNAIVNTYNATITVAGTGVTGISPDGTKFTNNQGDHKSVVVRNNNSISNGTAQQIAKWTTSAKSSGGPYWNRLRWSANSNDWVCFTQGGGGTNPFQMTGYHNIVLYNINNPSGNNVQVTNNANGSYDEADDFWVGDPSTGWPISTATLPARTSPSVARLLPAA